MKKPYEKPVVDIIDFVPEEIIAEDTSIPGEIPGEEGSETW